MPGYDFIAIRDQHQGVKSMGDGHDFNRIGNDFATAQGVLHADMIHGNAVANPDGTEFDGRAARHVDAVFNRLGDGIRWA